MPHAETRADPFPDMRKRVLALLEKSGPNCFIGWDIARAGGDASIVARYMADGLGKLWLIPDYLPDEWLDRITLEVDADGKPHWLWTGWNNGQGHAKVRRGGKTLYCHRDIVERVTGRCAAAWRLTGYDPDKQEWRVAPGPASRAARMAARRATAERRQVFAKAHFEGGLTKKQIAEVAGVSAGRVWQIIGKAPRP